MDQHKIDAPRGRTTVTAGVALVARIVKAGGAALVGFHRMYSGQVTPVGNRGRHFPRGPRDRRGPCTACRWMARLKHRMVHCGNRVSAPAAGPANSGTQAAKEAGKYRSEGKDYVVKDGDIILFRFNV